MVLICAEHLDDVFQAFSSSCAATLVKALGRRRGTKEIRYAHLLPDDLEAWAHSQEAAHAALGGTSLVTVLISPIKML